MLIIGLTGGIGSGKSTLATKFAALHVPVIDTDEIAHRLTAPGQPLLATIRQRFGTDICDRHGSLKRAELAQRVFADPQARQDLEAILHPAIWAEVDTQLHALTDQPYCIVVVPLLLETQQQQRVDRILVIDLPEALQWTRLQQRDGRDPAILQAIIDAQVPRPVRLQAADDVISNAGSEQELDEAVHALHDKYLDLAANKS